MVKKAKKITKIAIVAGSSHFGIIGSGLSVSEIFFATDNKNVVVLAPRPQELPAEHTQFEDSPLFTVNKIRLEMVGENVAPKDYRTGRERRRDRRKKERTKTSKNKVMANKEFTYGDLKAFLEGLTEEQLKQPVQLSEPDSPVRPIYASVMQEDYYYNLDEPEDGGTMEELREIHKGEEDFDESNYKLGCAKGTVLFFDE